MPIYDYECQGCHEQWEEQLTIVDRTKPVLAPCPHCFEQGRVIILIKSPFIGDPVQQGITKVPSQTREILSAIKKKFKATNMPDY